MTTSPETRMLRDLYEEAAYQFGQTYSVANEQRLEQARADFLEAYRSDVLAPHLKLLTEIRDDSATAPHLRDYVIRLIGHPPTDSEKP